MNQTCEAIRLALDILKLNRDGEITDAQARILLTDLGLSRLMPPPNAAAVTE